MESKYYWAIGIIIVIICIAVIFIKSRAVIFKLQMDGKSYPLTYIAPSGKSFGYYILTGGPVPKQIPNDIILHSNYYIGFFNNWAILDVDHTEPGVVYLKLVHEISQPNSVPGIVSSVGVPIAADTIKSYTTDLPKLGVTPTYTGSAKNVLLYKSAWIEVKQTMSSSSSGGPTIVYWSPIPTGKDGGSLPMGFLRVLGTQTISVCYIDNTMYMLDSRIVDGVTQFIPTAIIHDKTENFTGCPYQSWQQSVAPWGICKSQIMV